MWRERLFCSGRCAVEFDRRLHDPGWTQEKPKDAGLGVRHPIQRGRRVDLPSVPSAREEDLSEAAIRAFVKSLHSSGPRAHQEVEQGFEVEAQTLARILRSSGIFEGRSDLEVPVALLATFFRVLGSRASAWQDSAGQACVLVEDCPLARSLGLVGMDCQSPCARMRQGALKALDEDVSTTQARTDGGCLLVLRKKSAVPSDENLLTDDRAEFP